LGLSNPKETKILPSNFTLVRESVAPSNPSKEI